MKKRSLSLILAAMLQPLTIFWTIHKCYPELLTYGELAQEIHCFYEHFFLYDMSDQQIAEIIG